MMKEACRFKVPMDHDVYKVVSVLLEFKEETMNVRFAVIHSHLDEDQLDISPKIGHVIHAAILPFIDHMIDEYVIERIRFSIRIALDNLFTTNQEFRKYKLLS